MSDLKAPRARTQQLTMGTDYEFVPVESAEATVTDEESWILHDCYVPDRATGRLIGRVLSSRHSRHTLIESLFINNEMRKLARPIHYPSRKDAAATMIVVDAFTNMLENRSETIQQEPAAREDRDRRRQGQHRGHELPRAGVPKSSGGSAADLGRGNSPSRQS